MPEVNSCGGELAKNVPVKGERKRRVLQGSTPGGAMRDRRLATPVSGNLQVSGFIRSPPTGPEQAEAAMAKYP